MGVVGGHGLAGNTYSGGEGASHGAICVQAFTLWAGGKPERVKFTFRDQVVNLVQDVMVSIAS